MDGVANYYGRVGSVVGIARDNIMLCVVCGAYFWYLAISRYLSGFPHAEDTFLEGEEP